MGQSHQPRQQSPQQTPQQATQFRDAGDAFDQISPFLTAQFQFRQQGITQACNQLNTPDAPSLGAQILKSGIKLGLAAAAGALGAFTGGLGWVALGAIGLGFGIGGEVVDAVFSADTAPAGVEEFRTKRMNVLSMMQARETSELRRRLNQRTATDWQQAYTDYQQVQQNVQLQNAEINSTIDGWMNAVNQNVHGSGGGMHQGNEAMTDITAGRLHLDGWTTNTGSALGVGVRSANIEGLNTGALRQRYLDRSLESVGIFTEFAFYLGGNHGAVGFRGDSHNVEVEGDDDFKSSLGRLTLAPGPNMYATGHDFRRDATEGAMLVADVLRSHRLRDFHLSDVGSGSWYD